MNSPDYEISDEDLRAALKDLGTYIDVTEDDLREIYGLAMKHARDRLAQRIEVGDIMTSDPVSVTGDVDIRKVAGLLTKHSISGVPVVDEENRVIGIVTETDILSCDACPYLDFLERDERPLFKNLLKRMIGEPQTEHRKGHTARQVMTTSVITTTPDADIRDVVRIFQEKRIKRLPVVDDDTRLIGVISLSDIIGIIGK